jgi:hypothetical protein
MGIAKKFAWAAVGLFAVLGLLTVYSAGKQAVTDYQNFRKIVIWVYQKQAAEEQQRQRQLQQQQRAQQAPAPVAAPVEAPK